MFVDRSYSSSNVLQVPLFRIIRDIHEYLNSELTHISRRALVSSALRHQGRIEDASRRRGRVEAGLRLQGCSVCVQVSRLSVEDASRTRRGLASRRRGLTLRLSGCHRHSRPVTHMPPTCPIPSITVYWYKENGHFSQYFFFVKLTFIQDPGLRGRTSWFSQPKPTTRLPYCQNTFVVVH